MLVTQEIFSAILSRVTFFTDFCFGWQSEFYAALQTNPSENNFTPAKAVILT